VIVTDERVAETFTAPGDEIERLMYGYSLLCCLPDGMAPPALSPSPSQRGLCGTRGTWLRRRWSSGWWPRSSSSCSWR